MAIELYGVDKVMKALKSLDPEVDKEVRQSLSVSANRIVVQARGYVDPTGLSGWGNWRGGYDPSQIAARIKVTRGGRRKKLHVTSNYIGVRNGSAAGAIWEVAGRRSPGNTPSGRAMIRAITARGGPPSRTVWAAVDNAEPQVLRDINTALNVALSTVQSRLDKPNRGA